MNLHLLGMANVDKPTVLVFPSVLICLNCGLAEFLIGESELKKLAALAKS
jgi:hypothetical protein